MIFSIISRKNSERVPFSQVIEEDSYSAQTSNFDEDDVKRTERKKIKTEVMSFEQRASLSAFGQRAKFALIEKNRIENLTRVSLSSSKSILAQNSNKQNFDHLGLREPTHRAYGRINKILKEGVYSRVIYSDRIVQLMSDMRSENVILLITDENLYVLRKDNYALKYHRSLK